MVWIFCKPKIMFLNSCIKFHNHSFKMCFDYIGFIYFRIIIIVYIHTCSHTFRYIQFLVINMFNECSNLSSLITKFLFVVWSLSFVRYSTSEFYKFIRMLYQQFHFIWSCLWMDHKLLMGTFLQVTIPWLIVRANVVVPL